MFWSGLEQRGESMLCGCNEPARCKAARIQGLRKCVLPKKAQRFGCSNGGTTGILKHSCCGCPSLVSPSVAYRPWAPTWMRSGAEAKPAQEDKAFKVRRRYICGIQASFATLPFWAMPARISRVWVLTTSNELMPGSWWCTRTMQQSCSAREKCVCVCGEMKQKLLYTCSWACWNCLQCHLLCA